MAEAATKGPWVHKKSKYNIWRDGHHEYVGTTIRVADSDFIRAADPTKVLALLDALAAARTALDLIESMATVESAGQQCIAQTALARMDALVKAEGEK